MGKLAGLSGDDTYMDETFLLKTGEDKKYQKYIEKYKELFGALKNIYVKISS